VSAMDAAAAWPLRDQAPSGARVITPSRQFEAIRARDALEILAGEVLHDQ